MKVKELRKQSAETLEKELLSLLREQFNLRMQKFTESRTQQPHMIKKTRRNVARIKSILSEKAGKSNG